MNLLCVNCVTAAPFPANQHLSSRAHTVPRRINAPSRAPASFDYRLRIRRGRKPLRFRVSNAAIETRRSLAASAGERQLSKPSAAMEQLDFERGVCVPFRKYSPETVRNTVLESRGAIVSLLSRGVEIVWSLGFYWSTLAYDYVIGRDEEVVSARARQLRNLLCDLGPSFIKAGQVLANRPDIIREDYMNELCILQDDVPPFPNQVAFDIIEEEMGRPLESVFSKISSQTIAAASLGQVYRATLRDSGEEVAIKVQRPQIEPIIYRDLFLFRTLASFLNGISLQKLGCNAELIVDEFGEKLLEELDYTLEARNIEDFLLNFESDPTVKIPRVYKELCSSRVLVMEWIDGIRCTNPQAIKEAGIDVNGFLTVGVSAALRQLLEFGLFHGDPHPGNVFAMRDGRIAYVDFGNVAVLSQQNKQILIDAVVHAVNEDYVEMANDFTRLGFLAPGTDVSPIVPALESIWQNSVGKGLSDFNFRSVTGKFNQLVYNYPIRIPERFSLVIRSLLTQEGICFTLQPDFKFLEVAYPYVAKRLLTDPNPALRERLIQVLFKDGVFQWKRLENLIVLAKENVTKMSSNPAFQAVDTQGSKKLRVSRKLDLTDTIKDGARLFIFDEGIRRKLILALTEDSKLHIEELVDVYRLVEDQIDIPSVAVEVARENEEEEEKGESTIFSLCSSLLLLHQITLLNQPVLRVVAVTMPRKVNYGIDYDDEYDAYEDYDYDYDDDDDDESGIKKNVTGKAVESKRETERPKVWRCSICTYDNEESMSACDICGVLRNPLSKSNSDNKTVEGRCKDSGASIMARSIFASLPHQKPKQAVLFHQQKDDSVIEEGNNFHRLGDFKGPIHEFHKTFNVHNKHHIDIASFKFDVPSPDDVVSNGLWSSRTGSKAGVIDLKSSKASPNVAKKSSAVSIQSSAERSGSSSTMAQTKEQDRLDEENGLENQTVSYHHGSSGSITVQENGKFSESSSASQPTSRRDSGVQSTTSSEIMGKPQSVTSGLKNMTLDARSGYSNNGSVRESRSQADYTPEKWMLPDQAVDTLTQLNLAIVGHVDSGKSTLSGRLLHLLGRISRKEMHKYEKEAKLQGKGSFAYAWALDESAEERERGITMTVAVAYFDSRKYHVVVLDSPGHKDFVPNMISGATQADAAILLIDASVGAFEAGMDGGKGQTREHAQLIRSFGVDQIIVAVNKMDIVEYSKDRFDLIKQTLGTFLRSCGFRDSLVSWIPLSAMENQNLVAAPSELRLSSWYRGPYLLDAIDSLQPPTREFSKPLLMPVCDVIKSSSQGQVSACGKLEAGALRSGFKVLVMPSGESGTVRALERDSQACAIARAGDNVAVTLQGIDGGRVMAGGVLCHPSFPVAVAKHLELKVLVLDVTTPILIGSQLEFHIHHAKEAARVVKISSLLDPKTGKVTRKAPRCLTAKQSAVVEVILHAPVCVEEFSNSRALGRAFLRALGSTIAVGVVTRIIEEQK
ncbi:unnamed protein product [Malus baccata var. baccata]